VRALMLLVLVPPPGGFWERGALEFWGRPAAKAAKAELWPEGSAPGPVRALLEDPGPERAKAYLEWQAERMKRLRAAVKALREAASPPGELLYFARPGCTWCAKQERELEGLDVTRVPEGSPLWEAHGITAVPSLVLGGRVLRGFAGRDRIEKELLDAR
jgi:hypothetical protein